MPKVYLDTCAVQRPLDSQVQTRIRLEAEAVLGLFEQIDAGQIELIGSTLLAYEVSRNPLVERRELIEQFLLRATSVVAVDPTIAGRSAQFVAEGIKPADALHLALAESADVDFFCTCDERFLHRAKSLTSLKIQVVSPIELIEEIEK